MPYFPRELAFQHYRNPKHMVKKVQGWLFKLLDWPAQSPDLNPIENLSAYVKLSISKDYEPPS